MNAILPQNESLDVAEAIQLATQYLQSKDLGYGHSTAAAIDDAAWLVLESVGQSPVDAPDYTKRLTAADVTRCNDWLAKRADERIPVAYLVGRTWFAGIEFSVDSRALIPRSPLAELLLNDFYGLVDTSAPFAALDLCTGGGCIALAIASLWPEAQVVGSDLSADALALAATNRESLGLTSQVSLLEGDLFEPLRMPGDGESRLPRFDLIVSNPPYVDADDIDAMPAEFLHEPAMGLASGRDGLDITRRILASATDYLNPAGVLIVEVGNSSPALAEAYPQLDFLWLEFENGGDGVFALTREMLLDASLNH